jgi:hypothetical protein
MADKSREVINELTDLLKKCKIDDYILNTHDHELTIYYKEDFNKFFPKLNAQPFFEKNNYSGQISLPKFDYKNWTIFGNVHNIKPKKR